MFLGPIRTVARALRTHPLPGRIALFCVPDIRKQIDIPGIGPFEIRLRRNRSYWLRHPLTHEKYPLAMLGQLIRAGDTVFDVGGNIGMYTRFMLNRFGAGRVVAFEPMTENRRMLARNVALGGVGDRVGVLPYALSNQDEDALLQVDDVQTGSAALDAVTHGRASEGRAALGLKAKTERVVCRRLDTLMEQEKLPPPNVMKIDIEGAELMMLQGSAETLAHHSPRLLIELHGAPVARTVSALLIDAGYHLSGTGWKVQPQEHGRVDREMLPQLQDEYDLHFVVASKDPAELPSKVEVPDFCRP